MKLPKPHTSPADSEPVQGPRKLCLYQTLQVVLQQVALGQCVEDHHSLRVYVMAFRMPVPSLLYKDRIEAQLKKNCNSHLAENITWNHKVVSAEKHTNKFLMEPERDRSAPHTSPGRCLH